MPKLSAYVSDDLWARAVQVDPTANPSQLIQRGLNCLLARRPADGPPHGGESVPDDAIARIKALRERFAAEAKEEYERGYRAALDAAEQMPWYEIERFANFKFDVRQWAKRLATEPQLIEGELRERHLDDWEIELMKGTLGTLASPSQAPGEFHFSPPRARIRGFGDGLRAVFESVDGHESGLSLYSFTESNKPERTAVINSERPEDQTSDA